MAFEGEVEVNLKALLREDQSVSDILDSANPVAVYIFNDESKEWVCCWYKLNNHF